MMDSFQAGKDFILSHAYDPRKAHEYYLRNRELKGRQGGGKDVPKGRNGGTTSTPTTPTTPQPKPQSTPKPSVSSDSEAKRAAVRARVAALKVKLERLEAVFQLLVREAEARNPTPTEPVEKEKSAKDKPEKKLTAKEKREARKRSKEAYEKNKELLGPSNQEKSLLLDIQDVQAKIKFARGAIQASIDRARQQTTDSKPA